MHLSLLSIALNTLGLSRAQLGLALTSNPSIERTDYAGAAYVNLNISIEGLRASEQRDELPRGLLARAAFLRNTGNWDSAARDLDEVEEIAEPGPMRVHLCDLALERARLAFARKEPFAPLDGLIDGTLRNPAKPSEAERKGLCEEAAKQLAIAADHIEKSGYHRRDEEFAELRALLKGGQTFGRLPPRV
jgi:hypothetical protein